MYAPRKWFSAYCTFYLKRVKYRASARFVLFTSYNALLPVSLTIVCSFSIGFNFKWHVLRRQTIHAPSVILQPRKKKTATCTDVFKAFIARKIGSLVSEKN